MKIELTEEEKAERMAYCRGGKSDGDATMIPNDFPVKACRVIDGEVYVFGENGCLNYDETLTQQVLNQQRAGNEIKACL